MCLGSYHDEKRPRMIECSILISLSLSLSLSLWEETCLGSCSLITRAVSDIIFNLYFAHGLSMATRKSYDHSSTTLRRANHLLGKGSDGSEITQHEIRRERVRDFWSELNVGDGRNVPSLLM